MSCSDFNSLESAVDAYADACIKILDYQFAYTFQNAFDEDWHEFESFLNSWDPFTFRRKCGFFHVPFKDFIPQIRIEGRRTRIAKQVLERMQKICPSYRLIDKCDVKTKNCKKFSHLSFWSTCDHVIKKDEHKNKIVIPCPSRIQWLKDNWMDVLNCTWLDADDEALMHVFRKFMDFKSANRNTGSTWTRLRKEGRLKRTHLLHREKAVPERIPERISKRSPETATEDNAGNLQKERKERNIIEEINPSEIKLFEEERTDK